MICEYCRSDIVEGYHSPHWCLDYAGPEVLVRLPVTAAAPVRNRPDHDAYRRGLCCDCAQVPHSAGRPRCLPCHDAWTQSGLPEPGLAPGRIGVCAICRRPSAPGRLRCPACERERAKS